MRKVRIKNGDARRLNIVCAVRHRCGLLGSHDRTETIRSTVIESADHDLRDHFYSMIE